MNEILSQHWKELSEKPNYLNAAVGTKFTNGKDTGIPAIIVYVDKKIAASQLAPENLIPSSIEGIPVDVIQVSPTTWKVGKTAISQLSPDEQLRRLGYNGRPAVPANRPLASKIKFSQASNLVKYATKKIQNQQSCGECVGYGSIGVIEGKYRVQVGNPDDPVKLSEDDAFFCSGGTCNTGNDVPTLLNYVMNKGVCSEACQPSKNVDISCGYGRCVQWWLDAKRLASWMTITDISSMKLLLDTEPLIVVMAVPQSFFNYTGGIYKRLGPQDPIVGYHCIGCFGHNEPSSYWGPVRNSWGTDWGESGYFRIAFGECEIDTQMWQVNVDLNPVPQPPGPQPIPTNPPVVNYVPPSAGRIGKAYKSTLQVKNGTGTPPFTWSLLQGPLPPGLSLSTAGVLSGTPTSKGSYFIVVLVADSLNLSAGAEYTVAIKSPLCGTLQMLKTSRKQKAAGVVHQAQDIQVIINVQTTHQCILKSFFPSTVSSSATEVIGKIGAVCQTGGQACNLTGKGIILIAPDGTDTGKESFIAWDSASGMYLTDDISIPVISGQTVIRYTARYVDN